MYEVEGRVWGCPLLLIKMHKKEMTKRGKRGIGPHGHGFLHQSRRHAFGSPDCRSGNIEKKNGKIV
jgi:hypothetical protein